jgi:hypothetical protein
MEVVADLERKLAWNYAEIAVVTPPTAQALQSTSNEPRPGLSSGWPKCAELVSATARPNHQIPGDSNILPQRPRGFRISFA